MTDNEYGRSLERRFPWSFLGFVAGTLFGLIGVYSMFFYSREPDFRIQILSKAPVLSIREDVPNLEIMLNGADVRKTHKGISLLTLKVSNIGSIAITTADFDKNQPFLIQILNGEIIRSTIMDKSDPYFETVWNHVTTSTNTLVFPPFIIEPQQYFVVKLLILHDESVIPAVVNHGKIARTGTIKIADTDASITTGVQPPTLFGGDSRVQLFRVLTYGLGTALCIALLIALVVFTKEGLEYALLELKRRRRRVRIEAYLSTLDEEISSRLRPIVPFLVCGDFFTFLELGDIAERVLAPDGKEVDIDLTMFPCRRMVPRDFLVPEEDKPFKMDKQLAHEVQRMLPFLRKV